jgi:hypothetical protein
MPWFSRREQVDMLVLMASILRLARFYSAGVDGRSSKILKNNPKFHISYPVKTEVNLPASTRLRAPSKRVLAPSVD